MSVTASSSRGSGGSEEVEVCGRGRGIRCIDLPAVFSTPQECEMLSVITAFDLSRNELQELTSLQPLRSLTRLNASYNRISLVDGLPLRLTQLNLAHNKLEHLDCVSQLVHLRELDVSFNRLTSLAGLHSRVPLEVLRADDNRIDRTSDLKELRSLRIASLSNNYVEDLDELLFVSTTPALQLLNLVGNPVTRARQYRQTLAELQPSLVSLDGAPLTRAADYENAAQTSRGSSNGVPPAAAHTPLSLVTPKTEKTRSQRALTQGPHHPAREPLAAVKAPATHSAAVMTLGSSVTDSSSRQGRHGGAAQSVAANASIGVSSIALYDSPNERPREQPPQPVRRTAANPIARIPHQPAMAVSRAAPSGPRSASAEPRHNHSGAAEPPRHPRGSPACAEERSEDVDDTDRDVPPVVEDSRRGCRVADASVRTPEQVHRQVGYVSLHATPATGSAAERFRSGGRLRPFPSPASPQRCAASQQDLDSTTAQLHDSLVAKEQLEKECQTLRRACKRVEGQLAEARRVISQQLAELSQLRLERDALRESEGTMLERLEKEKRSGRTRASHHSDEVATLQAQYERMKTFYETQLADTRRELAAERARLLRLSNSGRCGERRAVAVDCVDAAERGQRSPLADERQRAAAPAENGTSELPAAASANPLRCLSPASRSASSSHPKTEDHGPGGEVSSTDAVAQQLTSWLYASLTGSGHAAETDESAIATAVVSELRRSLLRDPSASSARAHADHAAQSQESADAAKDSVGTKVTAVRRILETFISEHIGQLTEPPQQIADSSAPAQRPAVAAAAVDAPTQVGGGGSAPSQAREAVKNIEADEPAVACLLPSRLPSSPRCSSALPAHISVEKDDDDDTDTDTEVTVMISPPASCAVAGTCQSVAVAALPAPPQLPASAHNTRVSAAKAFLKEVELLLDS
ncbi:conserved hypothetical protein [Leishmania mexicana MHOM/GT/2001/U1103]|uniref:Leucine-rich repeat protein n=1 Tax=Leishmania mexicana (strain MHOM/GT/2001/U1103) TaxID=929439 RepID=E9AJP7_LEIMU|nr:conserved hypothetical protein [Leishmania mexicana MHOM/GT/2001/U1103]CBZ23146.1 conserved hypothetical protein [Leishmania mexicana MHOM/GT/2001/U1103]